MCTFNISPSKLTFVLSNISVQEISFQDTSLLQSVVSIISELEHRDLQRPELKEYTVRTRKTRKALGFQPAQVVNPAALDKKRVQNVEMALRSANVSMDDIKMLILNPRLLFTFNRPEPDVISLKDDQPSEKNSTNPSTETGNEVTQKKSESVPMVCVGSNIGSSPKLSSGLDTPEPKNEESLDKEKATGVPNDSKKILEDGKVEEKAKETNPNPNLASETLENKDLSISNEQDMKSAEKLTNDNPRDSVAAESTKRIRLSQAALDDLLTRLIQLLSDTKEHNQADELAKLTTAPFEKLVPQERFLLEMYQIPRVAQKLQFLKSYSDLIVFENTPPQEQVREVPARLKRKKSSVACNSLFEHETSMVFVEREELALRIIISEDNPVFSRLVAWIYILLKQLFKGTTAENFEGFKLPELKKLVTFASMNKEKTFLESLVICLSKNDPEILELVRKYHPSKIIETGASALLVLERRLPEIIELTYVAEAEGERCKKPEEMAFKSFIDEFLELQLQPYRKWLETKLIATRKIITRLGGGGEPDVNMMRELHAFSKSWEEVLTCEKKSQKRLLQQKTKVEARGKKSKSANSNKKNKTAAENPNNSGTQGQQADQKPVADGDGESFINEDGTTKSEKLALEAFGRVEFLNSIAVFLAEVERQVDEFDKKEARAKARAKRLAMQKSGLAVTVAKLPGKVSAKLPATPRKQVDERPAAPSTPSKARVSRQQTSGTPIRSPREKKASGVPHINRTITMRVKPKVATYRSPSRSKTELLRAIERHNTADVRQKLDLANFDEQKESKIDQEAERYFASTPVLVQNHEPEITPVNTKFSLNSQEDE